MPAADLLPTLERVAARARATETEARRPHGECVFASEAILEELTGFAPDWQWRAEVGPHAAAVVCLAKSVRILASMLAGREGAVIPIAGVLDDMAAKPADDPRGAPADRSCLGCGVTFASAHAGNRLCTQCKAPPSGAPRLAIATPPAAG